MDVVSTSEEKKKLVPYTATTSAMTMKVEVKKTLSEVYGYIWVKNLGRLGMYQIFTANI